MKTREDLLRAVYECQNCPESFGFSRPGPGRPYYKFPPTIGASGRAEVLFVGINPRRAGNLDLHESLMADVSAFVDLARNWDGRQTYVAVNGPERHYASHMRIIEGVFGPGSRFADHAAVTELFFCASTNATGLPPVRSACADRYFEHVLRLVAPRVVVCVGSRVFNYFGDRYGRRGGEIRLMFDGATAEVVRMPHPNGWMSEAERREAMDVAVGKIRAVLSRGAG